ncbi:CHD3-type chromatin-remodeling factor PICKLE [Acorus calamus]|uniref:CHD3-type chromatin-remodeling factor PICKLE n=1 Tax=Acorus calamus TaxID=4465 RepID=A0AAV9CVM2_ACOCL|nr:CHD3-type chromatin-remodeling factor PICKLE [Acorus calamus]
MEVTEEQIRRAEANRLAALEKRKRAAASAAAEAGLTVDAGAWRLFKCRKLPNPNAESEAPRKPPPLPPSLPPERFCVFLEICAADEFSITPNPAPDSPFPGKVQCLRKIEECLSSVVSCCYNGTQSCTGKYVYKLKDYVVAVKCLKKSPGILVNEIPYKTLAVCERFSHAFTGNRWMAIMEDHLSDDRVNELVGKIPQFLRDALLPYQLEGVRYGLRRGGKCLIADEMGLGKSIQTKAVLDVATKTKRIILLSGTPSLSSGKLAKEPEYFEDLFCGMDCFEHYRIRSSQKSLRGVGA